MAASLPIPDDLIALQRATNTAADAVGAYVVAVEARRREQYPAAEQLIERRTWTDEENADLERLRDIQITAALEVRAHPLWVEVRAAGAYGATWQALMDAARSAVAA